MKRHVKFYNTGYFLCGLKAVENGTLQDESCQQCKRESTQLFWGKLQTRFLKNLLDNYKKGLQ